MHVGAFFERAIRLCVVSMWVHVGVGVRKLWEVKAVEDKSGFLRYMWVSGSRGLLVSLTMHLNFHSLCYCQCSKKPEILNITNIACVYHPITACVLVYLGPVKILR